MRYAYLLQNLDEEGQHLLREMRVGVPQILDDALGPLEALLAERASRVQRHHSTQVF